MAERDVRTIKFRVERDVLTEAVTWTARSLPVRPSVPVLAGMRLTASDGVLSCAAYDYEVFAQADVDANVSDSGTVVVSGRLLADICKSLPAKPVNLVAEGSRVVLTCGTSRFTLATLDVSDLPPPPELPAPTGVVAASTFAEAVTQVCIAAGRDDMLPALTGVRVEIDGERVTMAATDRYRLAVRDFTWSPTSPSISTTALVPARSLSETAKSLGSGEVSLGLPVDSDARGIVGFTAARRRSASRLLDGEFPKFRTLFPSEAATLAHVDRVALVESVRRVALVAGRNPVKMHFRDGEVVLESGDSDDAQASESLPADIEGDSILAGFNPGYLLDGLGVLDAPTARFAFTLPTKPVVLQGVTDGSLRADYRYLLMPVRLAG